MRGRVSSSGSVLVGPASPTGQQQQLSPQQLQMLQRQFMQNQQKQTAAAAQKELKANANAAAAAQAQRLQSSPSPSLRHQQQATSHSTSVSAKATATAQAQQAALAKAAWQAQFAQREGDSSLSPLTQAPHQSHSHSKQYSKQQMHAQQQQRRQTSSPQKSVHKTSIPSVSTACISSLSSMGCEKNVAALISSCSWQDRIIYATKLFLSGNNINGFLRHTATVQRIKRQRARQCQIAANKLKGSRDAEDATNNGTTADVGDRRGVASQHPPSSGTTNKMGAQSPSSPPKAKKATNANDNPVEEERLKQETMNGRVAKRMRNEIEAGKVFCDHLVAVLEGILAEIDTGPADGLLIVSPSNASKSKGQKPRSWSSSPTSSPVPAVGTNPNAETAAEGNPKGSTLRRYRKRAAESQKSKTGGKRAENLALVNPFDKSGKRKLTKKEVSYREFEIARFRSLKKGDYVAVKMGSHELWILARVVKNWRALDSVSHNDLITMNESKKEALFENAEKVLIQDSEEYDGKSNNSKAVMRHLVLPLPRSFDEAEEWGTRCRKTTRVYAMYPNTTSLYCATVVDNTTYCRGNDDIIVVEFDGDEDEDHTIPQRHIPSRFVTLIPRGFAAANLKKKAKRVVTGKASGAAGKKKKKVSPAVKDSGTAGGGDAGVNAFTDMMLDDITKGTFDGGFDDMDLDSFSFDLMDQPRQQVNVATSFADIQAMKRSKENDVASDRKGSKTKKRGRGTAKAGTTKGNKKKRS